jgi:uncharacterized membrane protein YGL010W
LGKSAEEEVKEEKELEKAKFEYEYQHAWLINLLGLIVVAALGYYAVPDNQFWGKISIGILTICFVIAFFGYSIAENKKYKIVIRIYNKIIKKSK